MFRNSLMGRKITGRKSKDELQRKRQDTSSECYCKMKETSDESSLPSSQRLSDKNIKSKREKMIERATTTDLDMELLNKHKLKTIVLESPILSPETQNAIENAEKILEEARLKMVEVTKVSASGFGRRVRKELYANYHDPPLEDEVEKNLYIRELVSSKINKIPKNKFTKRRSVDLSAPKFRTMERRFSDTLRRPADHRYRPFKRTDVENSKFVDSNETKSNGLPVKIRTRKIKSLTIQRGPPLNIERELKKQNLGSVDISPDAFFAQNNKNINFYSFSHESCMKKDVPVKNIANEREEKSIGNFAVDVTDENDRTIIKNQTITEKIETLGEKSIAKDDVAAFVDVVEKANSVLFEGPINSEGIKKDRENVSEHLPRTGVDYFTLTEKEPNSYCSNDARTNEENLHREGRESVQSVFSHDIQNSSIQNERYERAEFTGDGKNADCNEKRMNDEFTKVDNDSEKYRRKKMANHINNPKSIKTSHERDLSKEFYNVIDKRFSDICEKYDASGKIRNETSKFHVRKENTDLSDINLLETDFIFNEIKLNPPAIETFDNILFVYDKIIDRVSKNEKKIDDTLTRLQATLSNEAWQPVISDSEVKSYDLTPLRKDDARSIKSNGTNNSRNVTNSDSVLSLSDESQSIIIENKDDKFFLNKIHASKKESRLIKKRNQKTNDVIGLAESTRTIENIANENKTLEVKDEMKVFSCDEKLENLESQKDDTPLPTLFPKTEQQREKKFEYERTFINSLSNMIHASSMMEEMMKHLQPFSSVPSEDIPTVFRHFIVDVMKRESGLILDFLSIQKQSDGDTCKNHLQTGASLQAIEQDDRCKIQKDFITGIDILQEPPPSNDSNKIVKSKEKSLEIRSLDSTEIKPTKYLVDEFNQTEIEILDKSTQYEVSYEQNALEGDDKIIEDTCSDKHDAEAIAEKKIEENEYPTREVQIYEPEIVKLDYTMNDDSDKSNIIPGANRMYIDSVKKSIMEDPNFSNKILDKLSDIEDCSFRTDISNVKSVNAKNDDFTTTSSGTSHSEGELYLPSSCSYSLGEIRIMKNSTSTCNHALIGTSTTCVGDTTSLLRLSSGEIYMDSSDTP